MTLKIGSRGSDLALWQARYVAGEIDCDVAIEIIKTEGDRIQHLSLDKVEGKGFFTKEIEAALLDRSVDIAVHSLKDLPTEPVEGLEICAIPARAAVRDVLITKTEGADLNRPLLLPAGARVGTSSLRRKAALAALDQSLELVDIRGNVPTRLGKVPAGELEAVVLAEAGLERLGLLDGVPGLTFHRLPVESMCPAPAQGALGIQIRAGDQEAANAVASLHDPATARAVSVERALLARFGGGCHLPLGAFAEVDGPRCALNALVAAPDGSERLTASASGENDDAIVEAVHSQLEQLGALRYL